MEHGGPVVHGADTSSPTPKGRLRSGDRQPGVDSSAATRAVTDHSPARGRTARPAARCAHPSRPGTEVPPVAPRPALHGLLSARTIDCWVPRRRPRGTPPGPPPHKDCTGSGLPVGATPVRPSGRGCRVPSGGCVVPFWSRRWDVWWWGDRVVCGVPRGVVRWPLRGGACRLGGGALPRPVKLWVAVLPGGLSGCWRLAGGLRCGLRGGRLVGLAAGWPAAVVGCAVRFCWGLRRKLPRRPARGRTQPHRAMLRACGRALPATP